MPAQHAHTLRRERHYPIFSRNLSFDKREDLAEWCRAVRACTDDSRLHWAGIQWFTALGHAPITARDMRRVISGRLSVIERQRAKIAAIALAKGETAQVQP